MQVRSTKIILFLFFSLFSLFGFTQNLERNDSFEVKIWLGRHMIYLVSGDTVSSHLTSTIHDYDTFEKVERVKSLDNAVSKMLLDTLLAYDIMNIPNDNYRGIDGTTYVFKITTPDTLKEFSYWSPSISSNNKNRKKVAALLRSINEIVDINYHERILVESLVPGIYAWGLTSIRIDCFLPEHAEKSTLYEYVVEKMHSEMNVSNETSHYEFPLIIIDSERAFLNDLNNYKLKKVREVTFHKQSDDVVALYGTSGAYGVITVKTK